MNFQEFDETIDNITNEVENEEEYLREGEEEQLSYKSRETKEIKIRHYCCGRYIKNSFMVACDICDDWLHVNCINYSNGLATVTVTYVCQRCIYYNFLGVISFLHYQIKKESVERL